MKRTPEFKVFLKGGSLEPPSKEAEMRFLFKKGAAKLVFHVKDPKSKTDAKPLCDAKTKLDSSVAGSAKYAERVMALEDGEKSICKKCLAKLKE